MTIHDFVDVTSALPLGGSKALLRFDDGAMRVVDLAPLMTGPVFDELRAKGLENRFRVDPELGTIVWPNGADLSPSVLRHEAPSAVKAPYGALSGALRRPANRSAGQRKVGIYLDSQIVGRMATAGAKQVRRSPGSLQVGSGAGVRITYSSRTNRPLRDKEVAAFVSGERIRPHRHVCSS